MFAGSWDLTKMLVLQTYLIIHRGEVAGLWPVQVHLSFQQQGSSWILAKASLSPMSPDGLGEYGLGPVALSTQQVWAHAKPETVVGGSNVGATAPHLQHHSLR